MATAGSEVTTSRIRTASQSKYSRSICSSEDISLEEAFHPRDAVPSPPAACGPSEDRFSWILENHPLNCQGCRDLLEESGLPMQCPGSPSTKPSSCANSAAMANRAIGINDEPTSDPTYSRSHASPLVGSFMGADSLRSLVRPLSDDIVSCNFDDHLLDYQACRGLSEEPSHPMQCPGSSSTESSSRFDSSEMASETIGMNGEPIGDPTHSRYHANLFMDAIPASSPARPTSDGMVSCNLEDNLLDCQAYQDLSEESSHPMQCPGSPSTKSSSRPDSSEMVKEAISMNNEPTGDPTQSRFHASLLPSTKTARCFGYVTSIPSKVCHRWLGSLLGLSSLALAIVSLLMFTVRSYRMAVWTTRNDELQACTGLIQAERPIGPNCERLISEGPQDPPYNLSRRMTNSGGPGSFFNLSDTSVVRTDLFFPVETKHSAWLVFASIFALISLADLLLSLLRQRSRTKDNFESLAAVEIATLPHHGRRSTIMGDDHPDTWFPGAHTDPSMGVRRRIPHRKEVTIHQEEVSPFRQEVKDEVSIEDLRYSIARYLNQPPELEPTPRHNWMREISCLSGRDT